MKFLLGFKFAFRGVMLGLREQTNMKIHVLATLAVVTAGIYFHFNYVDWCMVLLSIGLVIGLELVNTAVEEIVNFISPEKRVEAGRIKDMAAGAVLVSSIAALGVGILLILSKINL